MEYDVKNQTLGTILTVARYAIMICIYVGFSCIIYSIFTIEHPQGKQYTPPISVTMQCVINLTVQFFTVLAILFVGTRMRALLITNNKGAPQGWVQDGMYMATWAVLVQFLMVLGVAAAMAFEGSTSEVET